MILRSRGNLDLANSASGKRWSMKGKMPSGKFASIGAAMQQNSASQETV
jgi:hypothetical protein